MQKTVYLSGAITGLSYGDATDWRFEAKKELKKHGLFGLSPMRGKEYLSHVQKFEGQGQYAKHGPLSTPRGINSRDRFDCINSDALLVYLLGTPKVSIGTVLEIAWAHLSPRRIPIFVVIEDYIDDTNKNIHEHVMLSDLYDFRTTNLASAYNLLGAFFSDYVQDQLPENKT